MIGRESYCGKLSQKKRPQTRLINPGDQHLTPVNTRNKVSGYLCLNHTMKKLLLIGFLLLTSACQWSDANTTPSPSQHQRFLPRRYLLRLPLNLHPHLCFPDSLSTSLHRKNLTDPSQAGSSFKQVMMASPTSRPQSPSPSKWTFPSPGSTPSTAHRTTRTSALTLNSQIVP